MSPKPNLESTKALANRNLAHAVGIDHGHLKRHCARHSRGPCLARLARVCHDAKSKEERPARSVAAHRRSLSRAGSSLQISFLLLIDFTCAEVTELPSVRYARHC